ncbi:MAG TPA: FAD-dependent monooxygenase [Alphaproteobacteria bacterium]|nr:FAD-dependent monooxygenase [Alphaproteobacteria bacterium]
MKTEVLIIGGGIAGLTLGCFLGQTGLSVGIVEPRNLPLEEKTEYFGRTAALMGASVNILKSLGLWEDLAARTASLNTMRIIDDSNPAIEPVQIDFPAREISRQNFGHNIPNFMLHVALAQKISTMKNVSFYIPDSLENYRVENNKVIATLDNGKEIEAKIIIGADGKSSKTRKLAGIDFKENKYGQSAITCLIEHSLPHHNISTEHHRSGGPFTTVPMPGKEGRHYSSIVWIEKTEDSEKFITLEKPLFEQALQKRTRDALGIIKLASTPESWPLSAVMANTITAPRVALIAEAAHAMSPIGAQGLNLSLRDVATLAETIIDAARLGEDIGGELVLARYAKRRRLDMNTRFNGVDGYNRIVSNNISLLRGVRRAGLKTLSALPAFKHFVMEHGLSPNLDEGRLARGEKL